MDPVTIVEVGPRDGFQSVSAFIPTERKLAIVRALLDAGLRRIEVGSFVSPAVLPQMSDIRELLKGLGDSTAILSVLVPNLKGATLALEAGVQDLVVVISVSQSHNQSNVRRPVAESLADVKRIATEVGQSGRLRVNLATAFHCPYEGRIALEQTLSLISDMYAWLSDGTEIALCDTTGRALPREVGIAFDACRTRFPDGVWAYHAHDTFGLGGATSWSAYERGVRIFDASIAGLGGCPFAPGATGNVATEDLVYMFEQSGASTGIDPAALLQAARMVETIEGGVLGGRVRAAVADGMWPA